MNKILKAISYLAMFAFYTVGAQEVTRKDTLKGTALTISMDSKVEGLLKDLEGKCDKVIDAEEKPNHKIEVAKVKTTAEICRDNPRIMGFKIQVAVVKSNEEANKVKTYFRSKFPNIKAETDAALRPNYKVLVGSYFSKQSASVDLSKIRVHFPEAKSIEYRVFCVEAK